MNKKVSSLKTLIEIGSKGFFPLFDSNWHEDMKLAQNLNPSKNELRKIKKVIHKIAEYKNLERQKLLIGSLEKEEKSLFFQEFLGMVEGYILDEDPVIH